jgi:hypothetical protein
MTGYVLDSTTTWQVALTEATATVAPSVVGGYVDYNQQDLTPSWGKASVTTNGTTPVTVFGSPSGAAREIKQLSLCNCDSATHGVTVTEVTGAGSFVVMLATLAAGESLVLGANGWEVLPTGRLATGKIWVGDASGNAGQVTMSGDVTLADTGATEVDKIDGVPAALPAGRLGTTNIPNRLVELDAVGNCYLTSMALTAPPASPAEGDAYLAAAGATGAWAGKDGQIAYFIDGGWRFYAPFKGLTAFNLADGKCYFYTGAAWQAGIGPTTLAGYGITDAASLLADNTFLEPCTFSGGLIAPIGGIFYGESVPWPTGYGTYVANYVSPTYGARVLAYNGAAYQPLYIGARSGSNFSITSLANGKVGILNNNPTHELDIGGDLGVSGSVIGPTTLAGYGIGDAVRQYTAAELAALSAVQAAALAYATTPEGEIYSWDAASTLTAEGFDKIALTAAPTTGRWIREPYRTHYGNPFVDACAPMTKLRNFYKKLYANATKNGLTLSRANPGTSDNLISWVMLGDSVAGLSIGTVIDRLQKKLELTDVKENCIGANSYIWSTTATPHSSYTDCSYWLTGQWYEFADGNSTTYGYYADYYSDKIYIFYIKEPGAGSLLVESTTDSLSGTPVWTTETTLDCSAESISGGVLVLEKAAATHNIRLTSTGTNKVIGVYQTYTGEGGLQVWNFGIGGLSMEHAMDCPAAILTPIFQAINPTVISLEAKEDGQFAPLFLQPWVDWYSANVSTHTDYIIIGSPPIANEDNGSNTANIIDNEGIREIAKANDFVYLDCHTIFRNWETMQADGLMSESDSPHIPLVAQGYVANYVWHELGFDTILDTPTWGGFHIPDGKQVVFEHNTSILFKNSYANETNDPITGSKITYTDYTIDWRVPRNLNFNAASGNKIFSINGQTEQAQWFKSILPDLDTHPEIWIGHPDYKRAFKGAIATQFMIPTATYDWTTSYKAEGFSDGSFQFSFLSADPEKTFLHRYVDDAYLTFPAIRLGTSGGAPIIMMGTAPPTTGTYPVGSRVFNSAPAVGSPKGWICTVAGTPGTWVSEGDL